MVDIFENKIICRNCNKETKHTFLYKDGFKLRAIECTNCNKQWIHPGDLKDYERFKELKNRQFSVKLRMVGNSFSVTIPKEIIEFEEKFVKLEKEMDKMLRLSLEEPGKLILKFREELFR
jgi:hypothetical protein